MAKGHFEEPSETKYKCVKCGAEDLDRGVNPPAPVILTCWKCGSGRNIPLHEMMGQRVGMRKVEDHG